MVRILFMDKTLLILSLGNRLSLDETFLKENNVTVYFIYDLDDLQKYIRRINPDALLTNVNTLTEVVMNAINQISCVYGYSIPWICHVIENTPASELLARTNKVFFYSVGTDDFYNMCSAVFDAINVGREQKLRLERMFNNIS